MVEASEKLAQLQDGRTFEDYKSSLKVLVEEQLVDKEAVYLVQFGSTATPLRPDPVLFETNRSQCKTFADQWLSGLEGSGSCNLLSALRVALSIEKVDTICVVLCTQ